MNYYGWNPPFFGGHQNVMSRQSGDRLIKNDLLQLLLTMKGERVMRPTWGTIIKSSLFENITPQLTASIVNDIRQAVSTYEPRVALSDVIVEPDEDRNIVNIKLYGTYTNQPNQTFELELALPLQRATEA